VTEQHTGPADRWGTTEEELTMITATTVVATVPVTDLDHAKEFYGTTLGLTFLWETPVAVRYRCGPASELSVFQRPPIETQHTLAHFEVGDIDLEVKDLEAKGVSFLDYTEGPLATTGHIAQLGSARAAWFRDPDGNTLGLRQG
jgi:catechol 2,3-dioxygenase-like lactoylglutathione lyase family enzyme